MSKHEFVRSDEALPVEMPAAAGFRCLGSRRLWGGLAALVVLCLVFFPELLAWYRLAMGSDLHSHVILIPAVTIYLLVTGQKELVWDSRPSLLAGMALIFFSGMAFGWCRMSNPPLSAVDLIVLKMSSFVVFLWGIGLLFLGWHWMRSALFPMGFLLFMIPLPDLAVEHLEQFLMVMSACLSEWVFSIGGIPVFRNGQVLELPGTVLEVAKECSGIRSTWVLFITSVLASYMFLPTIPRRFALVAAVIPLGILRNAIRIYVIGWLCVHYGPEMIDSWIHHKGGPVFFAASLLPLFLMAWWLRKRKVADPVSEAAGARG
ncbi:MAG: exosortase/archaeosortase family protein [Verrucomicrobiota bacterium]